MITDFRYLREPLRVGVANLASQITGKSKILYIYNPKLGIFRNFSTKRVSQVGSHFILPRCKLRWRKFCVPKTDCAQTVKKLKV